MPKQGAIALLKTDHATVKKMFEKEGKLTKKDSERKASLFNQIKAALEVHAVIEEEIFYPAVKRPDRNTLKTKSARHTKSTSR